MVVIFNVHSQDIEEPTRHASSVGLVFKTCQGSPWKLLWHEGEGSGNQRTNRGRKCNFFHRRKATPTDTKSLYSNKLLFVSRIREEQGLPKAMCSRH